MKRLLLLTAALLCVGASAYCEPKRPAGSCGVERWAVKTSADSDWSKVNMTPVHATVAELNALTPPVKSELQAASNHRFPEELKTYTVIARLEGFKFEGDQDFHIVIQDLDDPTKTMIVEMPSWKCVPLQFQKEATDLRMSFYKRFGRISGKFHDVLDQHITIEITGVGFFDFLHGQTGVAKNGFELHRVMSWREAPEYSTGILEFQHSSAFIIADDGGKRVVTINMDGSVEYGEGYTADSAAKEFWETLSKYYPVVCAQKRTCKDGFWNPQEGFCQNVPYCPKSGCAPTPATQ